MPAISEQRINDHRVKAMDRLINFFERLALKKKPKRERAFFVEGQLVSKLKPFKPPDVKKPKAFWSPVE